jgi:leucyl aminopeptidase
MQIEVQSGNYAEIACDLVAFPMFEDENTDAPEIKTLDKSVRGVVASVLGSGEFKPELHRTALLHNPSGLKAKRLLLIGAGRRKDLSPARLREIAGSIVRQARSAVCRTITFAARTGMKPEVTAQLVTEGAFYGNYESDIYKTREKEGCDIERLVIVGIGGPSGPVTEGIRRGAVLGDATNFARTLANEPANVMTPSQLAQRAVEKGGAAGLDVQVLDRDEMEKLGMNTLLAVARGSDEPPKLIIMRLKGRAARKGGKKPVYALVGKGVTFDSGGISIKPSEKMEDMKSDMAGGAAVIGAMVALAQLRPRSEVIGIVPAVENLPSGKASRPGDVIKSYLGKTVEIINTDAEGRLILADALAYARHLGATNLIDIATLTGACVVALGMVNAGMMGTDQNTIDRLRKNCPATGEKLWQLPIDDEYRKAIKSEIADMKNVGNRWGGAITAAKFLQEFAEDTPWVHLDIAGVDLDHDGRPFAAKGATGFGVRTLVQLVV